jgi:hypothetical protein
MVWLPAGTAQVDRDFIPVPAPGVGFVDADGEAILVVEATNAFHLLNQTAALLWRCFDGESSIADICFDLADVLEIPFDQALDDTLEVTVGLVWQGLVYDARDGAPDGGDGVRVAPDAVLAVPRRPRLLEEPPGG